MRPRIREIGSNGEILRDHVHPEFLGKIIGGLFGGDDAADAAVDASNIQAQAQREALEFMKEQYAPIMSLQKETAPLLQDLILGKYDVTTDPFYQQQVDLGTGNILNTSAASGSVRGGNTIGALGALPAQIAQATQQGRLNTLMAPFSLNSGTSNIANTMMGIGQTQAQGITAGAQAQQSALGTGLNTIMGGLGLGLGFGLF